MPRRRRPKPPPLERQDPVERFGAMLQESAARERAERERVQLERRQAREAELAAAEHARALAGARRDVDRAIAAARTARRTGSGVAAADATWRQAKARLIELETGAAPPWAPSEGDPPDGDPPDDDPPDGDPPPP